MPAHGQKGCGFQKLSSILTSNELSDLQEVMRDKELNLRTDIYEILLQDETESLLCPHVFLLKFCIFPCNIMIEPHLLLFTMEHVVCIMFLYPKNKKLYHDSPNRCFNFIYAY